MPIAWGQATKPCDHCKASPALLFCRSDSAFLCGACDSSLHAANKLSSRHDRVSLCQVCEQAPAVVTCKADAAALCSTCDHDIHSANPLSHRHQRLPVVPFFHTPSDLAPAPKSSPSSFQLVPTDMFHPLSSEPTHDHVWHIPNNQKKIHSTDFLFSPDFDPFLDSGSTDFGIKQQVMDELCNHRSYGPGAIADSVVPIQPMSTRLDDISNESSFVIDFTKSKLSPFQFPAQRINQSVSSSDVGIVPDGNSNSIPEASNFSISNSTGTKGSTLDGGSTTQQLSPNDRKARVLRYREKRKNRRFEKTIRYASRKAYAEIRPRIKGRFAKRTHVDADEEADMIYGSAPHGGIGNFIIDDDMYGVVPSL